MFYIDTYYREVIAMHLLESEVLKVYVSEHGAELQSIYHKGNEREYLWQGDAQYWDRRSPILFPVVGKLASNTFYYKGRDYHLSQHGFARDSNFEVVEKSQDYIKFKLKANEKTMMVYPFDFKLTVSYRVTHNKLTVKYKVYNNSTELMYFSIGGHPAFNTDLSEKGIEDYYLEFDKPMTLKAKVLDKEVKLMSREEKTILEQDSKLNLQYKAFENDALILEGINRVTLRNKLNDQAIKMNFEGFPLLGVWTPVDKGKAPLISLEPLYGMADYVGGPKEIRDKDYIETVYPDNKFTTKYTLEIE